MVVISTSILGEIILGLAMGHLRDLTDRVFRTREQVERLLALDCLATVPRLKAARLRNGRSNGQGTSSAISNPGLPLAPTLSSWTSRLALSIKIRTSRWATGSRSERQGEQVGREKGGVGARPEHQGQRDRTMVAADAKDRGRRGIKPQCRSSPKS